jgi:hypothetical protein
MKQAKRRRLDTRPPRKEFAHPFIKGGYGTGCTPKTLVEMKIMELSRAIRSRPKWYEKKNNQEIVSKWRKEAQEQGATTDIINYVIDELNYYASLRDGALEPTTVDGVWQADGLIDAETKSALSKGVAILENVDDTEKDWHPGSNQQVLDLVHPSLFCNVIGVSLVRSEDDKDLRKEQKKPKHGLEQMGTGEAISVEEQNGYFKSKKYQWIPSEFKVKMDGTVKIQTYINNLHPVIHKELYGTIERIFERFVPLFNNVITELHSPRPNRVDCIPAKWYGDAERYVDEEWTIPREPEIPVAPNFSPPVRKKIALEGCRLQVIVKLANIVLTPESPEYTGGTWHVEGMLNERIVATGIYYYVSENITESLLQFRDAVCEPAYLQDDHRGVKVVYGLENDCTLNQDRGAVLTREDRCICFPNTMQHRVAPFKLADPNKPGNRKIIVFFLVDPSVRIPSTLHIAPQQKSWYLPIIRQIGLLNKLPDEIFYQIIEFVGFPMSLKRAKEFREDLMKERKYFVSQNSSCYFERPFALCEH